MTRDPNCPVHAAHPGWRADDNVCTCPPQSDRPDALPVGVRLAVPLQLEGSAYVHILGAIVYPDCIDWASVGAPPKHDPGHPHLIGGKFQSDKYPTTPLGKVPLSCEDRTAQDLLWRYAGRRRAVDEQFGDDLELALRNAGYAPRDRALPTDAELTYAFVRGHATTPTGGVSRTALGLRAVAEFALSWAEEQDGRS